MRVLQSGAGLSSGPGEDREACAACEVSMMQTKKKKKNICRGRVGQQRLHTRISVIK